MKKAPYSPIPPKNSVNYGLLRYTIGLTTDGYRIGIENWPWMYFQGTAKEIARQIFIRCADYRFYYEPAKKLGEFSIYPFTVCFKGETDLYFCYGAEPEENVDIDGVRATLITELDKLQPLMYFY